jgi:hypothetical protein
VGGECRRGAMVKGATSPLFGLRRWLPSAGLEGDDKSGEPRRSVDERGGEPWLELVVAGSRVWSDD